MNSWRGYLYLTELEELYINSRQPTPVSRKFSIYNHFFQKPSKLAIAIALSAHPVSTSLSACYSYQT